MPEPATWRGLPRTGLERVRTGRAHGPSGPACPPPAGAPRRSLDWAPARTPGPQGIVAFDALETGWVLSPTQCRGEALLSLRGNVRPHAEHTAMLRICFTLSLALMAASPLAAAEYFVAPAGSDDAPGTRARPFRTLGKAAALLQPGDTCFLRGGVYRETVRPARSGEPGRPIRFAALPGEIATVSGADLLDARWSPHAGGTYRAETDRQFIQLFVDGRMMPEARWPNAPLDDLMRMPRAHAGKGTDYETLADPNLPPGDWNGAVVLLWPGARWVNTTCRVLDYTPGKAFRFDRSLRPEKPDTLHGFDPRKPEAGNPYLLFGCLAALDSPGEWFLDAGKRALYLSPPAGGSPEGRRIEVKQRDLAFDLHGLGHIEVRGLSVFAAAMDLTDAHDCLIEECRLRYVDHFRETKGWQAPPTHNVTTGRNNEWRRCGIAGSAGTALRLAGEENRLVECVVRDMNYLGTYQGGVDLCKSVGAVVRRCTVARAGRDILQHHGSKRIRVEHCDLSFANMLNNDSGALYCWGTDGEGGVIAHNWVHDNTGDATVGIYLDNFCKNFRVHHNVVWNNSASGITLNSDSLDNLVCHNTLVGNAKPFGTFTYHGKVSTQKGTRVVNNLVLDRIRLEDPGQFVQGELAPEVHHNGAGAADRRGVPTAGSAAVDAGIPLPGINDGFRGKAPDWGAYEAGGEYWVPGATWKDPELPAASPMDLSFQPPAPVTERTMITRGLVLWLNAADAASVEADAAGGVRKWLDRSGQGHHAVPSDPVKGFSRVGGALAGRQVVRGNGTACLKVGDLRQAEGGFTLFVVSPAPEAGGAPWQRIAGAFDGVGNDWTAPNWMIMRPGGEKPQAYPAQVFPLTAPAGRNLMGVTLCGSPSGASQYLAGDIAEVLLFDRYLPFAEADAIEEYLRAKWLPRR